MTRPVVFYDKSQSRWKWIKRSGLAVAIVVLVVGVLFLVSLFLIPFGSSGVSFSPGPAARHNKPLPVKSLRERKLQKYMLQQIEAEFHEFVDADRKLRSLESAAVKRARARYSGIAGAFYTIWRETGLHSLRAHADQLTHVFPEWLHLSPTGGDIDFYDWNPEVVIHNKEVIKIARSHGLAILPVFNNAQRTRFDAQRLHRLLTSPSKQDRVIAQLKAWLLRNRFQGVNIDFENYMPVDAGHIPGFLKKLYAALHPAGLLVSVDVQAGEQTLDWRQVARHSDFVVLMGYDEHFEGSMAGPIASAGWFTRVMQRAVAAIPREKIVVGIANYGYDWVEGRPPATPVTFQEALLTAQDWRPGETPDQIVDFDQEALNPTFNYYDEDGTIHEVWFLDAVTAANQWTLSRKLGVRGAAVWVLGSEDPSVWSFLGKDRLQVAQVPSIVENMSYPYDVEFVGDGDILQIKSMPREGSRTITWDGSTGLYTDAAYRVFPSAFVFERNCLRPKEVALTFDDGPWEPYTTRILDILDRHHIKASFFLIGSYIDRYPETVERIWRDGHDIGNHSFMHPNMGAITERRAVLELNATQRALQSIIGRGTRYFRPPFNADAEPTSEEEVWPVVFASKLGYITVGEFIDPQDWNLRMKTPDGRIVRRRAEDMVRMIMTKVRTGRGNSILLHDGGGNRTETVRVVEQIIPQLQKEGYKFVTVSDLLRTSRESMMPPVKKDDRVLLGADRIVFEANYLVDTFLRVAFVSAIVLGTARMVMVIAFALIGYRRDRKHAAPAAYHPPVSVLIAAFNEERVILRTIGSVLASTYSPLEIIVVDDGSKDGTAAEVERVYGSHPQVVLIRQENRGKAAALNNAIMRANGEILVCLDADTIFAVDTVEKLVSRFSDPRIGAVAGNVKVGNKINILTYWQAIEYITSQNLDRRAYAFMNAVTVVPGAVGAWRKQALQEAGGYTTDTLAEDMDLTWRIRKAGWLLGNEIGAYGYTETPDTLKGLLKQRFRWSYGTLQCLWKHRRMMGRYGAFGRIMLPSLWLFQIFYQVLSPIVDLQIAWAVLQVAQSWITRGIFTQDWQPLPSAVYTLSVLGGMYVFFFLIELAGSAVAFHLEGERKGFLKWLFWQRFVYRQIMYAVVLRSLKTALKGMHIGWGKLERKGTVTTAEPGA